MELADFELKDKWTLWFHSVNDNDWSLQSYTTKSAICGL
jgi:hypothetical protein